MSGSGKPFVAGKGTMIVLLLAAMPALPLISTVFPDASETLISRIITLPSLATALSGFLIGPSRIGTAANAY